MICPFCSQWNPRDARRCAFCDNSSGAEQDGTASGEKRMRADQIARIPKDPGKGIELSVRDLLRVPEGESARQALMGPALLAIGAILMLLGLFVTC